MTVPSLAAAPPNSPAAPVRYAGLDGIRALAVTAVIVYHLIPGTLGGGFIGVDMFFVVSGFLITSLLLRESRTTGRIRLGAFWVRRARRLLPALAFVVLACSAIAGLLGGDVLVGLGRQLLGAASFTSNWVSIGAGENYFSDDSLTLFRNLWSLAVEEQFYLVWPLLLLLLLAIGRRRWALGVTGALAAASALAMAVLAAPGADSTRVYFGTDTHAFGLMIGALLAFLLAPRSSWRNDFVAELQHSRRPGRAVSVIVALLSLLVLAAAAVVLGESDLVSYRGGLLAVSLVTAALIWACVRPGSRAGAWLDNPVFAYVGQRSYGLYLWHWPVLVLVYAASPGVPRQGWPLWLLGGVALVITVAAALLSYRFVEMPVRRHGLRAAMRAVATASARSRGRFVTSLTASLVLLCCIAGGSLALTRSSAIASAEDLIAQGQAAVNSASQPSAGASAAAPQWTFAPGAVPPPGKPLPAGDQILAVGDSVMLASAPALQAQFPGIQIDAAVSRSMGAGIVLIDGLARADALPPVVVVGLATNGPVTEALLEQLRATVSDRPMVLVNAYAPRDWIPGNDDLLAQFAAKYRNVELADWASVAAAHLDLLASDQIHPGGQAAQLYADCVQQALQRLADLPPQRSADDYGLAGPPI